MVNLIQNHITTRKEIEYVISGIRNLTQEQDHVTIKSESLFNKGDFFL